ncbi:glycosyltransferase family 2 protein [Vicingaceae bacterium]|nr:glycosyltransferase family 2 protein [Vicingaceae bacterium]MDC1450937.1 glycosyltransferase family 2 protein [Vicingaceae bacterium]
MELIPIIIYGIALLFIFCYSLIQIQLVIKYKRYQKQQKLRLTEQSTIDFEPKVTVQLPLFNEKYVTERLIDCVAALDYPKDKLEIQILDDSTDETTEITKAKVEEIRKAGIDIVYIHRVNRSGYKAGALAEGTKIAKGDFIAIFDADFLPKKDFVKRMVQPFRDEKVGMVQSRWEHINERYSMLTKLQAFGLDAHFSVEQGGRNAGHHFINFNGTAGIWRKTAIANAGGWQSDTLTEDLDLSYRAQLKGWEFIFLEEVGAPAELPAVMNALKTQQFRWNKGAAECVRKNLGSVLRSKDINFGTKMNAIFHLMNSAVFICIVILALLSLPILSIKNNFEEYKMLFLIASSFLITLPILTYFYWTSMSRNYTSKTKAFFHFIFLFPMFLAVSMGLSLHNAMAVLEGYMGKKSGFIRTPKFNLSNDKSKKWGTNVYLKRKINPITILEVLLAAYFFGGILLGIHYEDYGLMPFHIMLFLGFGYVSFYSISHSFRTE